MIARHEWRWIARPALITFVVSLAITLILGFAKSKLALDGIVGVSLVVSTSLAAFVGWKALEIKRANIALGVIQSGGGAVIVSREGEVLDLGGQQQRKKKKKKKKKIE